jgi:hypothetical protein
MPGGRGSSKKKSAGEATLTTRRGESVPVIPVVSNLLNSARVAGGLHVPVEDASTIANLSHGLYVLLQHNCQQLADGDRADGANDIVRGDGLVLSQDVEELLRVILLKAQSSFVALSRDLETRAWPSKSENDNGVPEESEWANMVRTASYAPTHPVIHQLPQFREDHVNEKSGARKAVARDAEAVDVLLDLVQESEHKGLTCNKYVQESEHKGLTCNKYKDKDVISYLARIVDCFLCWMCALCGF